MSRADLKMKSRKMDLEEDFYAFDFDNEEDAEEEMQSYRSQGELEVALRQKEEEVILAAQLGNALLQENRQLKEEADKLHEHYTVKLEELEQSRHELRVQLGRSQAEWAGQEAELERDLRDMTGQKEELQRQLSEAQRTLTQNTHTHTEHTQQLQQQLQAAMEAERALSVALRSLQQEMRERGHTPSHDDLETVTTMKEQVDRLSQREQELERRLQCVCDENSELKENISSLHTQLTLQKQHSQQHAQEVAESRREVSVARERVQYLQQQIEALEEEVSLHDSRHSNASLLSELELSLDTIGLDREQVSKDVMLILRLLLPLAQGSQELTITHSLTHTQNQEHPETHKQTHTEPEEVDTLSDTHTHPDTQSDIHTHSDTLSDTHTHSEEMEVGQGDLQSMMGQLKDLAEELAQQYTSQQVSGSVAGVGTGECESSAQIQELTEQVCVLREENGVLRVQSERSRVQEEQLQQAIKDRDDAIAKKTLMEVELVRCKNDMMSLNNQLLEAIQRKLQLSQELEAWQDDIQVILNQQLRTQHQWEQSQRKPAVGEGGAGWGGNTLSFLRRPSRRMSTAPPPCPVVAPIPTVSAPLSAPSPWTDWFKRGK
ncbi:BICD family-like cargo adapter 1 isoform X3 [Engraulis encrasicolus]|uniref:BICD family-like cargo adapter 1 isoform X3 n=1 Tax=Engraulis encrasicolus TaxID=184585 RepID=UPI002FD40283